MLTKTAGGIKTQYTYNAGNQLVSDGTYKYTYDKIGNLVEKAGNGGHVSYAYNALNLLEQWTDGENTESYSYNAAGLISQVTTDTSTTALTWDILYGDGVVISANENDTVTDFTYGLERISASTKNGRTEYVYDGRGSVIGEVTKSGLLSKAKVTTKSYTPFGEQIGEKTSGFGYNGEYYNAETGQVYLRARFYEPEMNRFGQKDILRGSITNPQSLNRYTYCINDPVNFIDPSGMKLKDTLSKIGNGIKNAWNAVTTTVSGWFNPTPTAPEVELVTSAAPSVSKPQTEPYTPPYITSTSTPSNLGTKENDGKAIKSPSTESPSVLSKVKQACGAVLASKPAQMVLNIYLGYESFKTGVAAALIRNYGQTGADLIGAIEYLTTGKTTWANRIQNSINLKVCNYEVDSTNDTMYTAGLVVGDLGEIAIDILIAIFSGGASAGLKAAGTVGKGGEVLAVAAETVSAAGVAIEAGGIIDALKQSFSLGNDLGDLISQIKGNGNYNDKITDDDLYGIWNEGSFEDPYDSLEYHYKKHGDEVGANSIEEYLEKAEQFSENLKGAKSKPVDGFVDGVIRYYKNGKYIDIAPDGSIVSFGMQ